jgi:hypothetical protein
VVVGGFVCVGGEGRGGGHTEEKRPSLLPTPSLSTNQQQLYTLVPGTEGWEPFAHKLTFMHFPVQVLFEAKVRSLQTGQYQSPGLFCEAK